MNPIPIPATTSSVVPRIPRPYQMNMSPAQSAAVETELTRFRVRFDRIMRHVLDQSTDAAPEEALVLGRTR